MINRFEEYLTCKELSSNTIKNYLFTVELFHSKYKKVTQKNLSLFKAFLIESYKPRTVNIRLQAINKYLEFLHKDRMKLKIVKIQQKTFLEKVISNEDYLFLKNSLKRDEDFDWYFLIWFMAATGARINELLNFKVEHVNAGHIDIYSKGGKIRRIYIPVRLQTEAMEWLRKKQLSSGYIFLNPHGLRITASGVAQHLKKLADYYGVRRDVVYPHSFRHRFAKNFLEKFNDLSLLADLMGHVNIETTRIYLRRTANEQREIVDRIIDW